AKAASEGVGGGRRFWRLTPSATLGLGFGLGGVRRGRNGVLVVAEVQGDLFVAELVGLVVQTHRLRVERIDDLAIALVLEAFVVVLIGGLCRIRFRPFRDAEVAVLELLEVDLLLPRAFVARRLRGAAGGS